MIDGKFSAIKTLKLYESQFISMGSKFAGTYIHNYLTPYQYHDTKSFI